MFAGDGVIDAEEFEYVLSDFGVPSKDARTCFLLISNVSCLPLAVVTGCSSLAFLIEHLLFNWRTDRFSLAVYGLHGYATSNFRTRGSLRT